MHIGDKVRLLHGHEKGVITNILPNNIIEVEIEDGFIIPVLRKEVAIVAKEESIHFGTTETQEAAKKNIEEGTISSKGIYFSFIILNDNEVALHLVNNTDYTLLYSISELQQSRMYGISQGTLAFRNSVKIKNYTMKDFENWPVFLCQFLFHRMGYFTAREPLNKTLKLKASTFFKKKGKSPVTDKEGYIVQLDESSKPIDIDPEKLKEKLLTPVQVEKLEVEAPVKVVDLHIEKLVRDHSGLSNSEILNIQLNVFRNTLDQAIASGLDEITFIHGVGNGVLRQAIQREAGQMKNICYHKDAMKEKFGHGATLIKIK